MDPAIAPLPYRRAPELDGRGGSTPVAIVGAGLAGLALAVDLAQRGTAVTVLGGSDRLSQGARGICWTRRSFQFLDRLGVGEDLAGDAVVWSRARIFRGLDEIAVEDHDSDTDQRRPAFANLSQTRLEAALLARCHDFPDLIDLRFRHRVTGLSQGSDKAIVQIYTEDGRYTLETGFVVACDGARSAVRGFLGLDFPGRDFADRFLIADIRCALPGPAERLFWFQPPFHPGGTALLHRQPGDLLRLELQLGPDADAEAERLPDAVIPRLRPILGERPCTPEQVRVWSYAARRLDRFVHGRAVFVGDSAHVVPPFGARGGNGALQDADNLGWKLAAIVNGQAHRALLDSYDTERGQAADANIAAATAAADFLVPPSVGARALRDDLLAMAVSQPAARALINTGRLGKEPDLAGSPLQTADEPAMVERHGQTLRPGAPCPDCTLADGWLLARLGGEAALLCIGVTPPTDLPEGLALLALPSTESVRRVYGEGTYLVRPDQHVAARWAHPSSPDVTAAYARMMGDGAAPVLPVKC